MAPLAVMAASPSVVTGTTTSTSTSTSVFPLPSLLFSVPLLLTPLAVSSVVFATNPAGHRARRAPDDAESRKDHLADDAAPRGAKESIRGRGSRGL